MKVPVADQMDTWETQNLIMQWAALPHSMNNGPLWTWVTDGVPYAGITDADIYNCFEAIFLAAVYSNQIQRA